MTVAVAFLIFLILSSAARALVQELADIQRAQTVPTARGGGLARQGQASTYPKANMRGQTFRCPARWNHFL